MERRGYSQFCPVSMAAEIVCTRWTPLVLRELLCGSTRFNDLRRGVPKMSPTLLSKRLRELESSGVVVVTPRPDGGTEYCLTDMGEDLRPIVMALGIWGQRWVESRVSLRKLDPSLLMWDMRRWLTPAPAPTRQSTIQFQYPELPASQRNWWLVIETDGNVDLCSQDPGHEIDLLVRGTLRAMTSVWMGVSSLDAEMLSGRLTLDGDPAMMRSFGKWLGRSPFAGEVRRVA